MKKTLLLILAAALCVSLAAQPKSPRDLTITGQVLPANKFCYGAHDENANFVPSQRPSDYLPAPDGKGIYLNMIGSTFYYLTSNANMRNTVNWSPDGASCAATWTMGSSKKLRGTGINYYDKDKKYWGTMPNTGDPFERIENVPSGWAPGWGTHVFTEQGECVAAHCTAAGDGKGAMLINCREKRGEGEWIQSEIKGPVLECGNTTLLWPTMTAVGNTVHMVCVTDNEDCPYIPSGLVTHPLYYRSSDGGKTWEEPYDFMDVITMEELERISADDYVFTARGNQIVLLYHGLGANVSYVESTDGGNTWTRKVVYDCPPFDWNSTGEKVGPVMSPTNAAVAIGDDGVVHVAFGGHIICRDETTQPLYYIPFYSHWSVIFTWNSNKPTLTGDDFGIEYDWDEGGLAVGYEEKPFFMYAPGIGTDEFLFSDEWTTDIIIRNYDGHGFVEYPRLIAEGGKVYLMYSSVIAEPLLHPSNEQYVRGVFLTVSDDNGETYNQPENTFWLSYCSEFFYYDWTGFDPQNPMANPPDPIVVTENGYPTMVPSIKNNKIVLTWLSDLFQFPERPEGGGAPDPWISPAYKVYAFMIDVNDLNTNDQKWYMTKNIFDGKDYPFETKISEQTLENLQIYPNPATDNVQVKLETYVPFTATVTNMMGQVVKTIQGQGEVNFNVADFQSGIYIVNVKTASATTSQKLIVR